MPNGDHAAAASNFLTRKIGPLPAWAYGAAAAVVVGVVVLYQRGKSTTTGAASQASSPYASSAQGQLNYPPTVVVTPAGTVNTQSPGASTAAGTGCGHPDSQISSTDWEAYGGGYWYKPAGALSSFIKNCIKYDYIGSPGALGALQAQGITAYFFPTPGNPVPNPAQGVQGGAPIYQATPLSSGSGGFGGGAGTIGTRYHAGIAHLRAGHFVPFQPSQYVDGRGGGGIGAVAKKTGIPVIRLRSLNPHLRHPDGTYGHGIIRIA